MGGELTDDVEVEAERDLGERAPGVEWQVVNGSDMEEAVAKGDEVDNCRGRPKASCNA